MLRLFIMHAGNSRLRVGLQRL